MKERLPLNTFVYICTHTHTHTRTHITSLYRPIYVRMSVCMFVCLYVCMYNTYTYTHTHTPIIRQLCKLWYKLALPCRAVCQQTLRAAKWFLREQTCFLLLSLLFFFTILTLHRSHLQYCTVAFLKWGAVWSVQVIYQCVTSLLQRNTEQAFQDC
jgi:cytochrome bd-type quinol oxidase subunit 2